jgi:uncharacterized protein (DUF1697 family)
MQTWICLLRAVNLGTRNKVSMPRLRPALEAAGLSDVRTYLQSGNVIARSALPSGAVSQLVHDVVADEFGVDACVVVRDTAHMRDAVTANPFAPQGAERPHLVRVIFLAGKPDPVRISEFAGDASLHMVSRVIGHHVYVDYVDGVHSNPRTAAYFERVLRVQGTERNWRTVLALQKMSQPEILAFVPADRR